MSVGLLVSVRSVAEAAAALAGGAGVIDVKEPARGSLGRADPETVAAVVRFVAGRRPVSAALGELAEGVPLGDPGGLTFVKWGLAGLPSWRESLRSAAAELRRRNAACRPVAVAYADWRRAQSPPPEAVAAFVRDAGWPVLLLDTFHKDGANLLDAMPADAVGRLVESLHAGGIAVALAGSLGPEQIRVLLPCRPAWFAVRGAACAQGNRGREVTAAAVRRLVEVLAADARSGNQPLPPPGATAACPLPRTPTA